jgi:hypothetical protein
MRAFACPHCSSWLEFEDAVCLTCGSVVAYDPVRAAHVLLANAVPCANRDEIGCTWVAEGGPLCRACVLTRTRPASDDAVGMPQFALAETAKRRLVYQLLHLGLPLEARSGDTGLAFDLLAVLNGQHATTGHADGVITVDLSESSDAHREKVRIALGEPYRTLLGHFRHEIGHYYWQVLVDGGARLEEFRAFFGDETISYDAAVDAHYGDGGANGAGDEEHISEYALMHPWEDFAETFAHYLHITDVLETAAALGLRVDGPTGVPAPLAGSIRAEGAARVDGVGMPEILTRWHGFSLALNAVDRSMGEEDFYPFVITAPVADKLAFVHALVTEAAAQAHPFA